MSAVCDYYKLPTIYWSTFLRQLFAACLLRHIRLHSPVSRKELKVYACNYLQSDFPARHRRMNQPGNSYLEGRVDTATRYLTEEGAITPEYRGTECYYYYRKDIVLEPKTDNPEVEYLQEILKAYQRDGQIRETIFTHIEAWMHETEKQHVEQAEIILLYLQQLKEPETCPWWWLDLEVYRRGVEPVLQEFRRKFEESKQEEKTINAEKLCEENEEEHPMAELKMKLSGKHTRIHVNDNNTAVAYSLADCAEYSTEVLPSVDAAEDRLKGMLHAKQSKLREIIDNIDEILDDLETVGKRTRRALKAAEDL